MGSTFQISGLGSGVDTESMITALREYRMRPVSLEKNKITAYTAKQTAWLDINARILSLRNAAQSLTLPATYSSVKASVSDTAVASVTASESAAPGAMSLTVSNLAQARKVTTKTYSSATDSLGMTGDFSVNGKMVDVAADDTLTTLAGKINALNVGASASVVQQSPGEYRIVVAGTSTGRQDSLSLSDLGTGNTLAQLELVGGGAPVARYATGTGSTTVTSLGFSSASTALGTLTGLTTNVSGTFAINGVAVNYDTATDTLSSLADNINAKSIPGVTAKVVADSAGKQRLQIAGAVAPDFGTRAVDDTQGLMGLLGVTQAAAAATGDPATNRVLADAEDAVFTVDGLQFQRPTNTVSDAVSGVTMTLLKDGGATTSITLDRNTQATVDAVNKFVTAYNDVIGKIKDQSVFTVGGSTPALLGDTTLQKVQNDLASSLTFALEGSGYTSLRDIGLELNAQGQLSLDATTLKSALQNDPNAVSRLFTASSTADNPGVSYISSSNDTKVSTTGYALDITALAQKAQVSGGSAHAATLLGTEKLTFSGSLFGSAKTVTLSAGNTLAQTISQINNSEVGKVLTAYDDGGKLAFRSLAYGSAQSFGVISDQTGAGYSGIGTSKITGTGVDVAGTINGETARGAGLILTGNQDKGSANGLALSVGANATAPWGKVLFQRGVGSLLAQTIANMTDPENGLITQAQNTLTESITAANDNVTRMTESVDRYIENLEASFTRMEVQISKLKAQSSSLAQTIDGLNKSNDD